MIRNVDSIYGRASSYRSTSQQLAISRFVNRTYGWMSVGLLITGFVAFWVASSETALAWITMNRAIFFGILIAQLLLVMGLSASYQKLSYSGAMMGFLAYSALNGVTFSLIFLIYTASSIGQVFLLCAGMFGGLALFGSVTKKDLTGMGAFVGMGVWGLILVGIANIFIRSESLSLGLSVAGVLIFSGLTAYDAQRIRSLAYHYAGGAFGHEEEGKGAVFGALSLYLNFINLFLNLLRLFGNRRGD
jgi:uncharacterized protein